MQSLYIHKLADTRYRTADAEQRACTAVHAEHPPAQHIEREQMERGQRNRTRHVVQLGVQTPFREEGQSAGNQTEHHALMTNGQRINQLVAPTIFWMEISSRRANMASFTVLEMMKIEITVRPTIIAAAIMLNTR